jgi:hypothetical protein
MPIQSIIRKAITDHLVNHVNVGDDKRCRIDILCEQAEREILEAMPTMVLNLFNECAESYDIQIWDIKAGIHTMPDDKQYLNLYTNDDEMILLSSSEVDILDRAFEKSLISEPTRPNRK